MKSSTSIRLVLSLFLLVTLGFTTIGRMKTVPVAASGAMIVPVAYGPKSVCVGGLLPGETTSRSVTVGNAPSPVDVTASVVDDTSQGQFRNLQLVVYDVERGPNGLPLDVIEVGRSDGSVPLEVSRGQMLEVWVDFVAPSAPQTNTFTATLLIRGIGVLPQFTWQAIRVPLSAHIGKVRTTLQQTAVTIRQGEEGDLPFSVESIDVPSTAVSYVSYALADTDSSRGIALSPISIGVSGGSVARGNFHFKVGNDAPVGNHELSIYEYASGCQPNIVLNQRPIVNVTPGQIGEYTGLRWEQANPYAIQVDEAQNAWNAGRVDDILALDSGGVLAAAQTGGVWAIAANGAALPLSDGWDKPDVRCLAFGPDGPRHVFAGGSGLYETDVRDALPLFKWREIRLPAGVSAINRLAVLAGSRRIALACDNGVWWSDIPQAGGNYQWRQAQGLPVGQYSGIAVGPNATIAMAAWGANTSTGLYGIFIGDWTTGNLICRRANINGFSDTGMNWTSLASCAADQRVMYALTTNSSSNVTGVLRSADGGQNWAMTGVTLEGAPDHNPPWTIITPGHLGDKGSGGWEHHINVSPSDSQVVTICWKHALISANGGQSWRALGRRWVNADLWDYDNKHMHDDIHAVCFDPYNSQRLLIASDGGVTVSSDRGFTFNSSFNHGLLNLQFLAPYPKRHWWGTLAVSYHFPGLMGGGLQDNGNVYCPAGPNPLPWKRIDGGDGGLMLAIRTGDILHWKNGNGAQQASRATWDANSQQLQDRGAIPLLPGPGMVDRPWTENVYAPSYRNVNNQYMYAVGGSGAIVYGLFGADANMHWEQIGALNLSAGQYITATGSFDGNVVFVGAVGGRLFSLVPNGEVSELSLPALTQRPGDAAIARIVAYSATTAFATYNVNDSGLGNGFILRTQNGGQTWQQVGVRVPNEIFYSMDTGFIGSNRSLFVVTDNRVYVSFDNGANWLNASQGLPARPHCADLRFVALSDGNYLYLSAFGRSVWRARLN